MANLVVQTAFVGDLVLSLPLLKKLKRMYPDEELVLLCRKGLGEWLKTIQVVDTVVEYDKSDTSKWSRVVDRLKSNEFKLVVCPHQSIRSLLLVRRLKAEIKIGFRSWWRKYFFNRSLSRPMQLPDALRQISLLTLLDDEFGREFEKIANDESWHNTTSRESFAGWNQAAIPSWAELSVRNRVPDSEAVEVSEPIVFLAPGSIWPTKRWTEAGFIDLGKRLQERGCAVVITGSPNEQQLCDRVASQLPESLNLCGKTSLLETLQIFKQGMMLITNDSGAMHLAAAVDLPTLSVFGPTTLELGYRPWLQESGVVQVDLKCRPCGKHGAKKCPLGTHECMQAISSQQVMKVFDEVINPERSPSH